MSISFKIILDQRRPNATGTFPLRLRIYWGQEYKEHSVNIKVKPEDWDADAQLVVAGNPDSELHNTKLLSVKASVKRQIILLELMPGQDPVFDFILAGIAASKIPPKKADKPCLIKYGEQQAAKLKANGKVGNSIVYSCAINKLKTFIGKDDFPFESLTYKTLENFNSYLVSKKIKVNSISNYFRTIRAIYNKAIMEGVVQAHNYPFSRYKIKSEQTISRTLTVKEMQSIIQLDLQPGTTVWHWRNYFLLSFCLIGMNFADLLTLTRDNLREDRIVFRRKKTGKVYSIKIHPKTSELFKCYAGRGENGLLLPVLSSISDPVKLKADINQGRKNCNDYLEKIAVDAEIDKKVTTYYARYSWANIARSLGYSKDIIAEALGHEYGNRITGIYLDDYDSAIIDEVNNAVINSVFGKGVLVI